MLITSRIGAGSVAERTAETVEAVPSSAAGTIGAPELAVVVQAMQNVWPEFSYVAKNPNSVDVEVLDALNQVMSEAVRLGVVAEVEAVLQLFGWTLPLPATEPLILGADDLVYSHSFLLPPIGIFGAGQRMLTNIDIAYEESTDSLHVRSLGGITPVSIPAKPDLAPELFLDDPTKCRTAVEFGPRFQEGQLAGPLCDPAKTFGGFEVLRNGWRLIGYYEFYNVDATDNMGLVGVFVDELGNIRVVGPFRAGPPGAPHANSAHGRVTRVPREFALEFFPDEDPDHVVCVSHQRMAGAFGGKKGPSVYILVFNPDAAARSDFGARAMLAPPGSAQDLSGIGYRYAEGEEFCNMTWAHGPGYSTLLYGVTKGMMTRAEALALEAQYGPPYGANGANFYGPGPACTPPKGWHGHPYKPLLLFYAPAAMREVLQGKRAPIDVVPHAELSPWWVWRQPLGGCRFGVFAGMANAEARSQVFFAQARGYRNAQGKELPVIHVCDVVLR